MLSYISNYYLPCQSEFINAAAIIGGMVKISTMELSSTQNETLSIAPKSYNKMEKNFHKLALQVVAIC